MARKMRSYRVTVVRTVYEEAEVDVDATDDIEAEDLAIDAVQSGAVKWEYADVQGIPEIVDVEEVEP
jgi:hypothetical protein